MLRRALAILSTAIVFIVPTITTGTAAGSRQPARHAPNLVRIVGAETFEANALIQATFRFSPERLFPHSGESVRWIDQDAVEDDPHTVTVVRKSQVPASFEEIFACEPCNDALDAHFSSDPPKVRVNVGEPGLDRPGDSLLVLPGTSIGAQISAAPGTNLFYVCSIHPWMQGKLRVG